MATAERASVEVRPLRLNVSIIRIVLSPLRTFDYCEIVAQGPVFRPLSSRGGKCDSDVACDGGRVVMAQLVCGSRRASRRCASALARIVSPELLRCRSRVDDELRDDGDVLSDGIICGDLGCAVGFSVGLLGFGVGFLGENHLSGHLVTPGEPDWTEVGF